MTEAEQAVDLIRKHVQRQHDRHVWLALLSAAMKWRDGVLVDHTNNHVALEFDFQLEKPAFLDELIELIERLEPGAEGGSR